MRASIFVGCSVVSKAWRITFEIRNQIKFVESDSVKLDEYPLRTLSECFPPNKEDYADDIAVNLSSMGEMSQHPAPDANAAQNFDINHLPPLPSLN
jgi:hypothetical protein